MNILILFIWFLIGVFAGATIMLLLGLRLSEKAYKKKTDSIASKRKSINDRLQRVKAITEEQVELAARTNRPQQNALDGKHQNSLIARFKALDDEKNDLLRSVLAEGFDPELTTIDQSGIVSKIKLSEYMSYMGISMEPKAKTAQEIKADKMSKFTVFSGGKDDGNDTTH